MDKKSARSLRLSLEWSVVIGATLALIAGKGVLAQSAIIVLCAAGGGAMIIAFWEHGWLKAPIPIGTPARASLLAFAAVAGMAILGWYAWPIQPHVQQSQYSELDWARVAPLKIVHSGERSADNDVYQIIFKNFGHLKAKQIGHLATVTVVADLDISDKAHIRIRKTDSLNVSLPKQVTEPQLLALLVDPQWESMIQNSSLELNQDETRMFRHLVTSSDISTVLSGNSSFLFTIVFKWKDDSMSDNEIGVTEFCGVVSGRPDREFTDCGTKSFRTFIRQPK